MKVAVIGTGYVGLVTGTCFAEVGNDVTCVDIDENKIAMLHNGEVPIYEPGLSELVVSNSKAERLHFTTDLNEAVSGAEVIFLALPTPPQEDGSADLSAVLKVADLLGDILQEYTVIVNKSTVPVGTADKVRRAVVATYDGEFDVVSNPEFLREGHAIADFMEPDRVVIGTSSERAADVMEKLYRPFVTDLDDSRPLLIMDEFSSELAKYAANSFLALKISFINEIANLADRVGAEVEDVARAIGADARIGKRFLQAGIGYGGSCFPKDVLALGRTAASHDYNFQLLDTLIDVNERQKRVLIDKVHDHYGKDLRGKTFGVWGLAFKPDTDDIREAPALVIIDELLRAGACVKAYDPEAMDNVRKYYVDKKLSPELTVTAALAAKDVDGLIIATEWQEFKDFTGEQLGQILGNEATVFDGRNILHKHKLHKHGVKHVGIGHGGAKKPVKKI